MTSAIASSASAPAQSEVPGRRQRLGRALGTAFIIVVWSVCGPFFAVVNIGFYWAWDSGLNRGFHYGYWGTLNRISAALESLPGVDVHHAGGNEDITLEEMWFRLVVFGDPVDLFFREDDPIRRLKGAALQAALQQRIADRLEQAP